MKYFGVALLFLLPVMALGQTVTPPLGCPLSGCTFTGPVVIPGTTTNDNAPAGAVGEYISSEVLAASAVSLVTATAKDVTSISLTAGDWDVRANVGFNPNGSTSITELIGGITTTSNTLPAPPASSVAGYSRSRVTFTTGAADSFPVGVVRLSLAATTTVYLDAQASFATSTMAAYGKIEARRVR